MLIRPTATRACLARIGAHTVEFAVVIPVFFVFVLAFVEFGRGMMSSSMISNSARMGCRTGVLPGKANTDVTGAIDTFLQGQGIYGYTTTIQVNGNSVDVSTAQTGDTVNVQVSVPVANTSWLPGLSFLTGNYYGNFTMPHE